MGIELKSIKSILHNNVQELITEGKLIGKDIVIFGANKPAELVVEFLEEKGYAIAGIIDNNSKRRELIKKGALEKICGKYNLYAPEEFLGKRNENAIILVAAMAYSEMCIQLKNMGYDTELQTVQLLDYNGCMESEVTAKQFMDFEELRKVEFDLLCAFDALCREKGYRYYLCGGTLLGAVRHKGYIPWDDDIDVMMPVSDYLRFLSDDEYDDVYGILNAKTSNLPIWFTKFVDKRTSLFEMRYPFMYTINVNIDIFPVAGFPDDKREQEQFARRIIEQRGAWEHFLITHESFTYEDEEYKALVDGFEALLTEYDFENSKQVGFFLNGKFDKELMPRECFLETLETEFEGKGFPVFCGYKTYLENMYGDYMTLPQKGQQVTKHNFYAWWAEDNR